MSFSPYLLLTLDVYVCQIFLKNRLTLVSFKAIVRMGYVLKHGVFNEDKAKLKDIRS